MNDVELEEDMKAHPMTVTDINGNVEMRTMGTLFVLRIRAEVPETEQRWVRVESPAFLIAICTETK